MGIQDFGLLFVSRDGVLCLAGYIGEEHGGKTPAQVAINWCLCKGTLPIPGAKNKGQVDELLGAWGWKLNDGEMKELDA